MGTSTCSPPPAQLKVTGPLGGPNANFIARRRLSVISSASRGPVHIVNGSVGPSGLSQDSKLSFPASVFPAPENVINIGTRSFQELYVLLRELNTPTWLPKKNPIFLLPIV